MGCDVDAVEECYGYTARFCDGVHAERNEYTHERVTHGNKVVLDDAAGNSQSRDEHKTADQKCEWRLENLHYAKSLGEEIHRNEQDDHNNCCRE